MAEPYLGMTEPESPKVWDNNGFLGRLVGPVEDTYLEFIKHNENFPKINTKVINI